VTAAARLTSEFVSHPAEQEGIGLFEVLDRVTMQVFVRRDGSVIAAPVQRDVDGVPKGSHFARYRRRSDRRQSNTNVGQGSEANRATSTQADPIVRIAETRLLDDSLRAGVWPDSV